MSRRSIIAFAIGSLASTSILLAIGIRSQVASKSMPFDQHRWLDADPDDRSLMVASLLADPLASRSSACFRKRCPKQSRLYCLSLDDVIELLGAPDSIHEVDPYPPLWIEYELGFRGQWMGSQYALAIYFDENRIVESFFLGR